MAMAQLKESQKNRKSRSTKDAVAARAIKAKKSKKDVKVVEVALSPKKNAKSVVPATTKSRGQVITQNRAQSSRTTKVEVKSSTSTLKKKRVSEKSVVAKISVSQSNPVSKKVEKEKKYVPVVEEPKMLPIEVLMSPTPEILRPFRKAAKKNKEIALAQKKALSNQRAGFLAKPVKSGKKYTLDLRVRTPGTVGYFKAGGIEPGPALVRLAQVKGIDVIGLTDFYNASYIEVVQKAAESLKNTVTILPGIDLRCEVAGCKEVFIIALFAEGTPSTHLYDLLDLLEVPKSAYGKRDYIIQKSFEDVVRIIESHGGIVIPSRVDKTPYRQLAIPTLVEQFGFRAFDLAHPEMQDFFRDRWPSGGFTFLSFSNADALGQIGNRAGKIRLIQPGFAGVKELVARINTSNN